MRIGFARDIHRFSSNGREFILGGVKIPSSFKVEAHSDGDVLFHALSEALLGALALGDLGTHFNENDPEFDNIDSRIILEKTLDMVKEKNYEIGNVDISVILEKPKLRLYINQIRESINKSLKIDIESISLKAQTNEGLGEIGENKAIECCCVVLLNKIQ